MPEQDIPALCERVREAAEARKAAAASSDSAAWNAATRQLDILLTDVNTLRILADRDRLVKRVQALQDALGQIIGGREGEYQLFDAEWDRIIAVRKDREWPEPVVEEVEADVRAEKLQARIRQLEAGLEQQKRRCSKTLGALGESLDNQHELLFGGTGHEPMPKEE